MQFDQLLLYIGNWTYNFSPGILNIIECSVMCILRYSSTMIDIDRDHSFNFDDIVFHYIHILS